MGVTNKDTLDIFLSGDATAVAPMLLGWQLTHITSHGRIGGRIVETEAYMGTADAASHAFRGPSKRNQVMFGPAGHCYIYFTYGMHYCFNVVTGPDGEASGILIRALEPLEGIELMEHNRKTTDRSNLANGPAKLVQALGITPDLYGHDLSHSPLTLTPGGHNGEVVAAPRIGINHAVDRPWRFYLKDNIYVSRYRKPKL